MVGEAPYYNLDSSSFHDYFHFSVLLLSRSGQMCNEPRPKSGEGPPEKLRLPTMAQHQAIADYQAPRGSKFLRDMTRSFF